MVFYTTCLDVHHSVFISSFRTRRLVPLSYSKYLVRYKIEPKLFPFRLSLPFVRFISFTEPPSLESSVFVVPNNSFEIRSLVSTP